MVSINTGTASLTKSTQLSLFSVGKAAPVQKTAQVVAASKVMTLQDVSEAESARAVVGQQSVFVNLADRLKDGHAEYSRRAELSVTALKAIFDRIGEFKTLNEAAASEGASAAAKASAAARMNELAPRIESLIAAAGGDGVNWLDMSGRQRIVVSVNGGSSVSLDFTAQRINDATPGAQTDLNALLTTRFDAASAGSKATADRIGAAAYQVASYLALMAGFSNALASVKMTNDAKAAGLGKLVMVDLDSEGANLKAIEARRQILGMSPSRSLSRIDMLSALR